MEVHSIILYVRFVHCTKGRCKRQHVRSPFSVSGTEWKPEMCCGECKWEENAIMIHYPLQPHVSFKMMRRQVQISSGLSASFDTVRGDIVLKPNTPKIVENDAQYMKSSFSFQTKCFYP